MAVVLIICIFMALLSAYFWCLEAKYGSLAIKSIPKGTLKDNILFFFRFCVHIPKFTYLALDIGATIFLVGQFSLGGMVGACMGLTMSNVISIFLMQFYGKRTGWNLFHTPEELGA